MLKLTKLAPRTNTRTKFLVPLALARSDSRDKPYQVSLEAEVTCTCLDNIIRQRDCKHVRRVMDAVRQVSFAL